MAPSHTPGVSAWRCSAPDIAFLLFFVVGSFHSEARWSRIGDLVIACPLIADWLVRFWLYDFRLRFLRQLGNWADLIVIVSLLLPCFAENYLFLRVLRSLRLFQSYHVLRDLREHFALFRRNEEAIEAAVNLAVFVFIMSAIVYMLQVRVNPGINNYIDALYFTVTTLTTTGFGDIVVRDTPGRLLAVAIMIAGFGLFLRLVQAIFRPRMRKYECPQCGLPRHELDAVHCKHCGHVVKISTEGSIF